MIDESSNVAEALFLKNSEHHDGIIVDVGRWTKYFIKIPHYVHGDDHYVLSKDVEKIFDPIFQLLGESDVMRGGAFLSEALPKKVMGLEAVAEICSEDNRYNQKTFYETTLIKFSGSNYGDEKRQGILPVAEFLANVADYIQCEGNATLEEVKCWVPIISGFVENKPGLSDSFGLSSRGFVAKKNNMEIGSGLNLKEYMKRML